MSNQLIPRQFVRSNACGKFGNWYVAINERYYLHNDAVVRYGTQTESGNWSGFFATEAEALAAIEAYKAKNGVKP